MINNQTISHKLDLISDQMLDVADDMGMTMHLSILTTEFINLAEKISLLAERIKEQYPSA